MLRPRRLEITVHLHDLVARLGDRWASAFLHRLGMGWRYPFWV